MPDADKLTPADADLAKALAFRRGDAGELVLHEAEQEAIREMVALRAQGNPNSNEGPWPLTRQPDNSSGRAWSLSQYARGLRRDWQRRCHAESSTGRRGDSAAFSLAADPTCYPAFFRGAVFWGLLFRRFLLCTAGNRQQHLPAGQPLRFAAFLPFGATAATCGSSRLSDCNLGLGPLVLASAPSLSLSQLLWRSAAIRIGAGDDPPQFALLRIRPAVPPSSH